MLSTWLATIVVPVIMLALSGPEAWAQGIACRYELAATIAAPPGPINSSPTIALAISPNGRYVVGYFNFDAVGAARAFAYDIQTSIFHALPLIDGTFTSTATDVNDAGQIAGHIGGVAGDFGFVYELSSGTYALLPPLHPDGTCWATGITAKGVVCGYRGIGGPPGYPTNAVIWTEKSGFTDFGVMNGPNSSATAIAEDSTVVGWTGSGIISSGTHAFVWRNGAVELLPAIPEGRTSAALAVSSANLVTVYGRLVDPQVVVRGFGHFDGSFVDLGVLPGFLRTFPLAVDSIGQVIGYCTSAALKPGAFPRMDGLLERASTSKGMSRALCCHRRNGMPVM